MSYPKVDILYLSEKDMLDAGVNDVVKCTDTMEEVVKLLDDGDYLQAIGEEGAMRARLRLLTAGNSYIVPQCGDIVGIHNVDPSQITLARWERFCAAMDDLAKRQGWG